MFKMSFDLSELFTSDEMLDKEIVDISNELDSLCESKYEIDADVLCELLDKSQKLKERANNVLIYGSLLYYKDIKSSECAERKKKCEKFNSDVNERLKFIDRIILDIGYDKVNEFFEVNSELLIYRQYIDNLFRLEGHIQSEETSFIVNDNEQEINSLIMKYNDLMKNLKYPTLVIDGEEVEINASNYGKYVMSRDRSVRRDVYLAVNESYRSIVSEAASILFNIYKLRIKNSELEGYGSVLEKVLFNENIDGAIVNALIESVDNSLYDIQRYLKLKGEYLGIDEVHLYDLSIPLIESYRRTYSIDEAIDIVLNALKPLGDEYVNVCKKLLSEGHFDAECEENKHQSIIFSWNTYSFMNFRGSYIDLKNLVHELGHIVNYYLSKEKQPYLYEDSAVFIGEISSLVNEMLLNRYLFNEATSEEEKMFYLSKNIENFFTTVIKQIMYTKLENELYNKILLGEEVTSDEISSVYRELSKKYYGDNVVYDDGFENEWIKLGHLFRWSYYPYKYASGLVIANSVYEMLRSDRLSLDKYREFLSAGSSKYSLLLLKDLGIDLFDSEVIDEAFNNVRNDINEFEKIMRLK